MVLSQLSITALRNIASAQLTPHPGFNLIIGPNGSGKSALLEALYLLSSGRSFRASRVTQLIRKGESCATLFGVVTTSSDLQHRLGVAKRIDGSTDVSVDGVRAGSSSALAERLAVQVVTPESVDLIDGQPLMRRRFIDWGMFHIEPRFHAVWLHYERSLRQRNSALRQRDRRGAAAWEQSLADHGTQLAQWRSGYVEQLRSHLVPLVAKGLLTGLDLQLQFRPGWDQARTLGEVLAATRDSDLQMGYTVAGPHRDDLLLRAQGDRAAKMLSRGQKKLLVLALLLAQFEINHRILGDAPIVLIDDIAAELDEGNRRFVLEHVVSLGCQLFVTGTDSEVVTRVMEPNHLFYVEQGCFCS